MFYKCLICGKNIKMLKKHLKFSHNTNLKDYFNKYESDFQIFENFMNYYKLEVKKQSPNCLEFYLNKGFEPIEAEIKLKEFHSRSTFKNRNDVSVSQINYWILKGYTIDEAKEKVSEYQRRDLNSLIALYGIEEGTKRYNHWQNSLYKRKETTIQNYMKKYDLSYEEAVDKFLLSKIIVSPRRPEYWTIIKPNIDPKILISQFYKENSKRSIEYYIKRGFSDSEAILLCSEYQDNNSIKAITERLNIGLIEAYDIQSDIMNRMVNTKIDRGLCIDYNKITNFNIYKCLVWRLTNKNFRRYKDQILNSNIYTRSINYHLDHRFSIYDGYKNGVSVEIIAGIKNLELIPAKNNLIKSTNSSITLEYLLG